MNTLNINQTQKEAVEFLRKITGRPRRSLTGQEYEHVWTMIMMMPPVSSSNNQHTCTDVYIIGNQKEFKEYHVTYWPTGIIKNGRRATQTPPTIELIIEEPI